MAQYNGHRSWNAWNVSLWIHNDVGLYNLARECIHITGTRDKGARDMLAILKDDGIIETPDGAPYTVTSIREAMRYLD